MADQTLFLISGAIGIGPALVLLWLSLKRFDYPNVEKTLFDDRKVFFALAVGLIMGTVSSVFSLYTSPGSVIDVVIVLIVVIMFEESFKLVYLNRKGYRTNFASTYYGVSLGLGMAATVVLATGMRSLADTLSPVTLVLLVVYAVGVCTTYVTTGAIIGYGCSKGEPWNNFFLAVFIRAFYTFVSIPFLLGSPPNPEWLVLLSLGVSVAVGIALYYYVYIDILPGTLPPDLRRLLRKGRKARMRSRKS